MAAIGATYSGDPSASDVDGVRFRVGDTDCDNALLFDSEIESLVTSEGSVEAAAVRACEAIAAKLARRISFTTGRVSKSTSDLFDHYTRLAERLRADLARCDVSFYAGGLSKSEDRSDRQDEDAKQPNFEIGQHDNPRGLNRDDPHGDYY